MTIHHPLSPSRFSAWSVCPCFDSDPVERDDAKEGTAQHAALVALLRGDHYPVEVLAPDGRDSVHWAAQYVRGLAHDHLVFTEHPVSYTTPDAFAPGGVSEVFHGTADVIIFHPPGNIADLVDYKSGAGDCDHRP